MLWRIEPGSLFVRQLDSGFLLGIPLHVLISTTRPLDMSTKFVIAIALLFILMGFYL